MVMVGSVTLSGVSGAAAGSQEVVVEVVRKRTVGKEQFITEAIQRPGVFIAVVPVREEQERGGFGKGSMIVAREGLRLFTSSLDDHALLSMM